VNVVCHTKPSIIVPTLDFAKGHATAIHAMNVAGCDCGICVVEDDKRQGFTKTVNEGLRLVAGGDAVILVDDCEPDAGWLKALRDAAEEWKYMRAWFVGPSGPCRTWPQNSGTRGNIRKPQIVGHLAGFCLYVTQEALAYGLMDESYVHYASDVDWQRRMEKEHRARSLWVPSVYVAHELHEPHADWWRHDQALLQERWHSTPGMDTAAG